MMTGMRKFLRPFASAFVLLALASPASAQDDEEARPDARLEGYKLPEGKVGPVALPPSGSGGTWAIFVLLGLLGIGVMFKNGKRTHLD
jgi:hypothetical protein